MRWFKSPEQPEPQLNDKRVLKKFAWYPILLDDKEWIWLESYNVLQRFSRGTRTIGVGSDGIIRGRIEHIPYFYWDNILQVDISLDPLALWEERETKRVAEMNARVSFTLEQWIKDPDIINRVCKKL